MTDIEQAKELKKCIMEAREVLQRFSREFPGLYPDTEIKFRHEVAWGVLRISENDLDTLIEEWEKDEARKENP